MCAAGRKARQERWSRCQVVCACAMTVCRSPLMPLWKMVWIFPSFRICHIWIWTWMILTIWTFRVWRSQRSRRSRRNQRKKHNRLLIWKISRLRTRSRENWTSMWSVRNRPRRWSPWQFTIIINGYFPRQPKHRQRKKSRWQRMRRYGLRSPIFSWSDRPEVVKLIW